MLDKALKQNRDEDKDPFFSACAYGDLKGAQDCVDIGGSEPHKARKGWTTAGGWIRQDVTPIWAACYGGHLLVCQYLCEQLQVNSLASTRYLNETPFWVACFKGNLPGELAACLASLVDTEPPRPRFQASKACAPFQGLHER